MTIRMFAAAMIFAAAPAYAQYQTDLLDQHADTVRQRILLDKTLNRDRRGASSTEARARATCADKDRIAAKLGSDTPKARRLYALCAQAGY